MLQNGKTFPIRQPIFSPTPTIKSNLCFQQRRLLSIIDCGLPAANLPTLRRCHGILAQKTVSSIGGQSQTPVAHLPSTSRE
jgi:hypothetical protein